MHAAVLNGSGADSIPAFLVELASALHRNGTSAPRLEATLSRCAQRFGICAQFFSNPTAILVAFGAEGATDQRTHLIRLEPGEADLGKLAALDALIERVVQGEVEPEAAQQQLRAIMRQDAPYRTRWSLLSFALVSAAAARLFGGGLIEILVSSGLGLLSGAMAIGLAPSPQWGRLVEPVVAFTVTFLALLFSWAIGPLSYQMIALSALIIFVPGLQLTVAMSELAMRHLVSGTARLSSVVVRFLSLAFGLALARGLGARLLPIVEVAPAGGLPPWTELVLLIVAPLAFTVLFKARISQAPSIMVIGLLGFLTTRWATGTLGPALGTFVGALQVGLLSNLRARWWKRPKLETVLPGILLLVPGSIGFRSLNFFLSQDVLLGVDSVFRMSLVAVALALGLLLADVFYPPRRQL